LQILALILATPLQQTLAQSIHRDDCCAVPDVAQTHLQPNPDAPSPVKPYQPASDQLPPNPDYATALPLDLSAGDKAVFFYRRLLNFGTALGPAAEAAAVMASPPKAYPLDWRQGAAAFGRNYGAVLGRVQTAEFSRFVGGVVLREDPRYYPSPNRNAVRRVIFALAFTLADHSDSGHTRPAFANLIGATAGGFVGDAYLPGNYTDLRHAGVRTGIQMASFAIRNMTDEFAPELTKLTNALKVRLHPGS
jgi:hypothetical protein